MNIIKIISAVSVSVLFAAVSFAADIKPIDANSSVRSLKKSGSSAKSNSGQRLTPDQEDAFEAISQAGEKYASMGMKKDEIKDKIISDLIAEKLLVPGEIGIQVLGEAVRFEGPYKARKPNLVMADIFPKGHTPISLLGSKYKYTSAHIETQFEGRTIGLALAFTHNVSLGDKNPIGKYLTVLTLDGYHDASRPVFQIDFATTIVEPENIGTQNAPVAKTGVLVNFFITQKVTKHFIQGEGMFIIDGEGNAEYKPVSGDGSLFKLADKHTEDKTM